MILSEIANKPQIVVVYPGRFQPWHKGHKSVYDYLSNKFDNVYVATSDKVDPPKSPFSFEEKKKMMELTGMDTANIVLTKSPYNPKEITQNFDEQNTILIIAVSEKDMAEDPRFAFKPKKDGSPSYFQPAGKGPMETMDKHGYIMTVPTADFTVLGKPMRSATEIRAIFRKLDAPTQKKLIKDLFGNYSKDVHRIMAKNITETRAARRIAALEKRHGKSIDKILEGGWEDTVTQQTKLTPSVVKAALEKTKEFVDQFNVYLADHGHDTVEIGNTTGSSAYYKVDAPNTEYGDIDLQVIVPDHPDRTAGQAASFYNKQMNEFIAWANLGYVYDKGKPANGSPIFKLDGGAYVQVDFLWAPASVSDFARWRVTPERGIKGLITGNLYGVLGEIMNMSIQHAAYMKIKDGEPVNYQRSRKVDDVIEVTSNIRQFGLEILAHIYQAVYGTTDGIKINDELKQYPGLLKGDVKISNLVHTIRGLAQAFEDNKLYGKYNLKDHSSKKDFLNAFMKLYKEKANARANAAKLDKATSPAEIAKRDELRAKIAKGVKLVQQAFNESAMHENYELGKVPNIVKLGRKQESVNLSLTEANGKLQIKILETGKEIPATDLIKLYERGYRNMENRNMSAQKLGLFAKGKNKISLWEHDGKVVLVHQGSQRLQESKKSVGETVSALQKKGYVCESVDIVTMKNAAGQIMRVFYDSLKGSTTIRDKEGGSRTYEAPLQKVVGALQKKGYQKADDADGGLSLVPTDAERQQGLI